MGFDMYTDYDDWYFDQSQQALKTLPDITKSTDFDSEEILCMERW